LTKNRAHLGTLVEDFEAHRRDIAIVATRGVRTSRTSYGELAHLARRFAAELETRAIRKGDRVIIWGENCAEWSAAFFGCILRGVLPVPLDHAGSHDFAARVAADVRPRLVVGDPLKIAALGLPSIPFPDFASALTTQTAQAVESLTASDPLQIIFTSGTTGQPKGIVHTHANVLASLRPIETEMAKYLKYERPFHPIRIMHTLPLSHVFGQFMGLWTPPLMAAELHYESRLVARELVLKIKRERISVLAAVPRLLDLMETYALERFGNDRFRGLPARIEKAAALNAWQRWWHFRDVHGAFGFKFWSFIVGGASLSPASEQFWGRLGFVVVQGYGMTETTALVSVNHPFHAKQGTIGQVLPGREVKLSDDGEVLVRGETISNTVWREGHVEQQDSEWLHTGDLAEMDAQGNLKFRGRKKDIIVTAAGLNIYPEDLEAALNRQAGVKASAVIEAQTESGPEPVAVLVLTPGTSIESVVHAANSQLAEYQQIRRWHAWPQPDFPRTSTGKILKREIVLSSVPAAEGDLNLDSLGRVELQAQVEQQFGVSLNDQDVETIRTQEDLNRLISQGSSAPVQSPHVYWKFPWNPAIQFIRAAFLELIALPLLRLLAKPSLASQPAQWPSVPALIVCNHITSYDAPFVLFALPAHIRRRVAIAMSGELMLEISRVSYWLITVLFNVYPLPRSVGFKDSFQHAGEAINRGYSVLVFPEGHRSDDGKPQPFRAGSGLLWKQLGVPVIPVRIDGLGELKMSGKWFRSGRVSVRVGEALMLNPQATPEQLTEQMREAVFGAKST
jgi:long-chain acyl-CoA synthetase